MIPAPRTTRLELPTGQRVEVRVDLSVRVMLRSGLVRAADEFPLIDALDDVALTDRALGRALQDALVLHALQLSKPAELDALAEPDYLAILEYAAQRLAPAPVEVEDDEAETEDDIDAVGAAEPAEETIEEALARMDALPKRETFRTPESASVLDDAELAEVTHGE